MSKMHKRIAPPTAWKEARKHTTGRKGAHHHVRHDSLILTPIHNDDVCLGIPDDPQYRASGEAKGAAGHLGDLVEGGASLASIARAARLHVNTVRRTYAGQSVCVDTQRRLLAVRATDLAPAPKGSLPPGWREGSPSPVATSVVCRVGAAREALRDASPSNIAMLLGECLRRADVQTLCDAAKITHARTGRRGSPHRATVGILVLSAWLGVGIPRAVAYARSNAEVGSVLPGGVPSPWACYRLARRLHGLDIGAAFAAIAAIEVERSQVRGVVSLDRLFETWGDGNVGRLSSYVLWSSDPEERVLSRLAVQRILGTARERLASSDVDLLTLIAEGATHTEIAGSLGCEPVEVVARLAVIGDALRPHVAYTLPDEEQDEEDGTPGPRCISSVGARLANTRGRHDRARMAWRPPDRERHIAWDGGDLILARYPQAMAWDMDIIPKVLLGRPDYDPVLAAADAVRMRLTADWSPQTEVIEVAYLNRGRLTDQEVAWFSDEPPPGPIPGLLLSGGTLVAAVLLPGTVT